MTKTIITILISGIVFFGIGFLVGKESQKKELERIEEQKAEEQAEIIEQQRVQAVIEEMNKRNSLRSQACSKEAAEANLKYWMNFNYPDWKITTDITVVEAGDCTYDLRFTAINPHFLEFGMKDK